MSAKEDEIGAAYHALQTLLDELRPEPKTCEPFGGLLAGILDGGRMTFPQVAALRELFNELRKVASKHPMTVSEFEKSAEAFFRSGRDTCSLQGLRFWEWLKAEAKDSQWALIQRSERKYGILRIFWDSGATGIGGVPISWMKAEYLTGFEKVPYDAAWSEINELRREEREARKEKEQNGKGTGQAEGG